MSGHSKWKTIQHKKGAADAKRGKIFSRLSKEIMMTARAGGGNVEFNVALRTAVQNAREANMPMDNITRAIKKGTGELEGAVLEEIMYEGFAAGGIGLVVKVLTDNKNRTVAEIRHIFTKHGSNLAPQGSVSRGFQRKGRILVEAGTIKEDDLMEAIIDAGAEDMSRDNGEYEVVTDPAAFESVVEALQKKGIKARSAEISYLPQVLVPVQDQSAAKQILRFIEDLEENDDVQDVYANCDIEDKILQALND